MADSMLRRSTETIIYERDPQSVPSTLSTSSEQALSLCIPSAQGSSLRNKESDFKGEQRREGDDVRAEYLQAQIDKLRFEIRELKAIARRHGFSVPGQ